jgi:O-antigen ligase
VELTNGLRLARAQRAVRPAPSTLWLSVGSAALIVVLGALVVVRPAFALLLAGACALAGVLSGVARVPVAATLVLATIGVVALVDLPREVNVGPLTSYALITVVLSLLIVVVSVSSYVLSAVRGTGFLFVPLYAFAGWALLSMLWFRPSIDGGQNVLVYAAFAALVPVTTAAVVHGDLRLETARRAFTIALLVACGLYTAGLASGGLGSNEVIGSRSFALVGVIGVAWGVAHVRFGFRRYAWLTGLCWLLILFSLSRLAFAAAIIIVALACIDFRDPARFVRSALLVGSVGAVAYYSLTSFGPMASRFAEGDVQSVGGGRVTINFQGRLTLWGETWRSYLESPIVGKGAASAVRILNERLDDSDHPHNDYLRVLHDFGVVGLFLLVASLVGLLVRTVRASSARGDPAVAAVHLAALLTLLGLLVGMITDNVIVYLFVVAPTAIILGLSIGSELRARRYPPRPDFGSARPETLA